MHSEASGQQVGHQQECNFVPPIVPWIQSPDFVGAARAGSEIGLSEAKMHQQAAQHAADLALRRDELSARMSQEASERAQQQKQAEAALALRESDLKMRGLLGQGRLDNQAEAISARDALERSKPLFANTGGGLMQFNPDSKTWNKIEGTQRPPAQRFESVPTYIPPVPAITGKEADVTTHPIYNFFHGKDLPPTTNSPAIEGTPEIPGHWYNKRVPVQESGNAADALTRAKSQLPDFGVPNQYKSAKEVKAAYASKEISYDDAVKILTDQFPLDLQKPSGP